MTETDTNLVEDRLSRAAVYLPPGFTIHEPAIVATLTYGSASVNVKFDVKHFFDLPISEVRRVLDLAVASLRKAGRQ